MLGETISSRRVQGMAMKFANILGDKFFSLVFSFLLDQRIRDTLCGTKGLWLTDWLRLEPYLGSWGIRNLWRDYKLLFAPANSTSISSKCWSTIRSGSMGSRR